jgi:FtsP/CotA-like multicopper oxidase with cupredoxin domain
MKGNRSDCFKPQCVTADGVERTFMSVNRQLPGPSIQVCENDIIVVDVENQMEGTASTIHWHGLLQRGSPYSDGVPFLTQCPIAFGTSFRYVIHAMQTGTHLYHSHAGQHKANGIYGALVIRNGDEKKDVGLDLPEFIVLCSDWMHVRF